MDSCSRVVPYTCMCLRAMSANSAAVNMPHDATNSFSGRVHGSRRLVIAVFTGLGGDKDDSLGEAILDGRRRFGDHAQPETEALPGGSETQVVDQRGGQRTRCDAVDGSQLDSRIGQRAAVPLPVPGFSTSRRPAAGLVVCCRHRRCRPYASSRSIVLRSCRTSVLIGDDAEVGAHYVVVPAAPDDRADLLGARIGARRHHRDDVDSDVDRSRGFWICDVDRSWRRRARRCPTRHR